MSTVQQEVLHLKNQISHQSRNNFKLEKDLRFLDSKIALLINHKITAEVRRGGEEEEKGKGKKREESEGGRGGRRKGRRGRGYTQALMF